MVGNISNSARNRKKMTALSRSEAIWNEHAIPKDTFALSSMSRIGIVKQAKNGVREPNNAPMIIPNPWSL
jgi:hypothetical protein